MVLANDTPFSRQHEDKQSDTFTVRLSDNDRIILNQAKKVLEQPKDSTALKMLATIGSNVLQQQKIKFILSTVFKNKRKNWRTGISEFD